MNVVEINPKEYSASLVRARDSGIEAVSSLAKRNDADVAINGGFFKLEPNGTIKPSGTLVISGIVFGIKNKTQALAVIHDGKLTIRLANPKEYLRKNPGISMVSGIPLLVNNGKVVSILSKRTSGFYAKPHARTAIGIKSNGIITLVTVEHLGMTLVELARFLEKQGCHYALNLDGGGSSVLWMKENERKERLIGNNMRSVADAIVFKKIIQ